MKTEAAVLCDLHGQWQVQEVELGDPREGEVRVRLADLTFYENQIHGALYGSAQAGAARPRHSTSR